jgi:Spy/CpxP family protein refolding chaperone
MGPPPGGPGAPGAPGYHGGPPPPSSGGKSSDAGPTSNSGAQFGPVGRWWDDKSVSRTVGLTGQQKKKMDAIFDSDRPAILAAYRDFLKQQSKLDAVSKDPKADKSQTFAAIDAVNQARDTLQKTVTQMYLEIRQQMTPQQVEQVEKLQQ